MNRMIIQPIQPSDIKKIAELHKIMLPNTLSSSLGEKYLQDLYKTLIRKKGLHICLAAYEKKELIGVITVSKDLAMTQKLFSPRMFWIFPKILYALFLGRFSPKMILLRIYFERAVTKHFPSPYSSILTIFVSKKYQKQKVGTKLLHIALQRLRKEKLKNLYVDTLIENKNAQLFYKKAGFRKKIRLADSYVYALSL